MYGLLSRSHFIWHVIFCALMTSLAFKYEFHELQDMNYDLAYEDVIDGSLQRELGISKIVNEFLGLVIGV